MLTTNFRPKRKTVFTTFYSFKGGVGRTMSLINVACILASRGRRVLMIDFDLEAPGLTNLALRDIATEADRQRDGLVELIQDFVDAPEDSPLADEANRAPFFDKYVRHLHIPDTLEPLEGGSLHLLPCGRIDATYTERLYAIDFKQLYAEGVGQPLFKYLKTYIRDAERYDYVLIDSRTGFSDEGGICTRDLADHIFIITGLNRQNIDGTVQFLRQLEASGWQEGQLVFVASPVPTGLEELRDERIKAARAAIEQTRFKADFKLRIPYHPRLALDEEPFIYRWSDTDLFPSYQRIARVLRNLADDTPQVMSREVVEAINQRQFGEALSIAVQLTVEEPDVASSLLTSLTTHFADTPQLYVKQVEPFFELLLKIDNRAQQCLQFATFLLRTDQYKNAQQYVNAALDKFKVDKDELGIAHSFLLLGHTYIYSSDFERGLTLYKEANNIFILLNVTTRINTSNMFIGSANSIIGNYQQALKYLQKCILDAREDNDMRHLISSLLLMGVALLHVGDYEAAMSAAEEALDLGMQVEAVSFEQTLTSQIDTGSAHNLIGSILLAQQNYHDAYSEFTIADALYVNLHNRRSSVSTQITLGYIKVCQNDTTGLATIESCNQTLEELGINFNLARGRMIYADALFHTGDFSDALSYLEQQWSFIQRYAEAQVRYESYIVRAKIKAALGDTQGAIEDAQVAVDFYREQGVHTLLAQEAEELVKLNHAAQDAATETSVL